MKRMWIAFVCLFALVAFAGLRTEAAPWGGTRPSGTSRGPTLRKGKPPRERGEIPGTLGVAAGPRMAGTAVYPAQDIPLKFTHGQHLGLGLGCEDCHTKGETSTRSADLLVPTGAACDRCHGQQHPLAEGETAKCSLCHTKVEDGTRVTAGLRMPRPLLHFNHKLHMDKGSECESCHGDMSKVRLASRLQLPREAKCLECHDGFQATDRCGACHPSGSDGRILTRAQDDRALPALVPRGSSSWGMAHDLAFVEDHAPQAKANPKLCASCHDDQFCLDCHDGAIRPMRIHAGDYLTVHALDARGGTMDCQSCHRLQSFCVACHDRLGFEGTSEGPFGAGGALRFHPEGWAGPPGDAQGHAHAAQRNIAACVSCHDEDSCLACHATTAAATPGLSVSPHGSDFARSARCDALSSHNRRVCLRCHAPGDMNLECL